MKRQQSLLMVDAQINSSDQAALNEILLNHNWFKNVFLKNQATNSELDPDFKIEEQQDYKDFIKALVTRLAVKSYRKGQLVINKGEKGEEMFIVNQGSRHLTRRRYYFH